MNNFFSINNQYETAIEKIIYLKNIKAFWNELPISIANKLANIIDIQKIKPKITHFSNNHLKSFLINVFIRNRIPIKVIDISGIAGPVKSETGSKSKRIKDNFFKLDSKDLNI